MFPCLTNTTLDRYRFIQLSDREIVSTVRIRFSCVVLVYATMSRVAKWKIEKAKVKVVFRLQFHATNDLMAFSKLRNTIEAPIGHC
uniref:Uncharacterized protein n=2 Tax=Helianthus annuus TaxID=4232 RepID=A0A251UXD0_HELAN